MKRDLLSLIFGVIALLIVLGSCCLSGCAGYHLAVITDNDRALVASAQDAAKSLVVAVGEAGLPNARTAAQVAEQALTQLAQTLGTSSVGWTPVSSLMQAAINAEIAGTDPDSARVEELRRQGKSYAEALEILSQEKAKVAAERDALERANWEILAKSREDHQKIQTLTDLAASKIDPLLAQGGLVGLLLLIGKTAWKNRRLASALVQSTKIGQAFKEVAESNGTHVDPTEVVEKFSGGYEHELADAYEAASGKEAKLRPDDLRAKIVRLKKTTVKRISTAANGVRKRLPTVKLRKKAKKPA